MNSVVKVMPDASTSVLVRMGQRFGVDPDKMLSTLKGTAFKGDVTNEQMMALLVVADQYGLNPWTKELFAFPDKRNGIIPVVSVDGWARIINTNPQFDGMEFVDGPTAENKMPEWIECVIHRKDRGHPIRVREYMSEVYRSPIEVERNGKSYKVDTPWQTHPRRMLRHKATIQCARLAFGFAGIYDQDEAVRIIEAPQIPETIDHGPRPDTAAVDMTLVNKYVSEITDVLNMDKEEADIAAALREIDAVLGPQAELYTLVFDALASRGIISKANYRKYLKIGT